MTAPDLKYFRSDLEARQADLEELIRNRELIAINTSADLFDQIQYAVERDLAIGNLERDSARLREVRASLGRIQQGTFGICTNCEEDIGPNRLRAMPWAALCVKCREEADRRAASPQSFLDEPLLDASRD